MSRKPPHYFLILSLLSFRIHSYPIIPKRLLFHPPTLLRSTPTQQQPQKPKWMKCINALTTNTEPTALNEVVSRISECTLDHANFLIEIGAVWLSPDSDEYLMERVMQPSLVDPNMRIRIYPHPRRFTEPCRELLSNERRMLYEDTTFVVVDKPPMLPTQPDVSNYLECIAGCLPRQYTTIDNEPVSRLRFCHRVDTVVGGCVVLSKDKNGVGVFAKLQRERKIKKIYLAVTEGEVEVGRYIHYMYGAQVKERGSVLGPSCQLVRHSPPENKRKVRENWVRCILEVTKSEPITIHSEPYYQNTIRLVTGRKHQVRAQLASLNRPILHDTLYQPLAGLTLDNLESEEDEERLERAIQESRVPTQPIGLQAHAILFGGVRVKAGHPWWVEQQQ